MRQFSIHSILFAVLSFLLTASNLIGQSQEGIALVMNEDAQGKLSSCKIPYDKNQLVATHVNYLCGTRLKVTNLSNNKSVEVKVVHNDNFGKGHLIALSSKAASEIGMSSTDEVKVSVELVKSNDKNKSTNKKSKKDKELNIIEEAANMEKGGLYKMEIFKLEPKGYGVQVAGYSDYESVVKQISVLQKNWFKGALVYVDDLKGKPYYKVIMGPFFSKEEAESYKESIKSKYGVKDAFIVNLETTILDTKK
jgi:rare lipoprotein A